MARKVTTRINGGPKTEAAVFSTPESQWTPDWDKQAGSGQSMVRAKVRREMGNKRTPIGPGKLMKKSGG